MKLYVEMSDEEYDQYRKLKNKNYSTSNIKDIAQNLLKMMREAGARTESTNAVDSRYLPVLKTISSIVTDDNSIITLSIEVRQ